MMSEPWNCTCVEHGDPIARLRDGYTAGASDPSAAHDEFDRLVRLAGLDADHAAALEREAIAAWLEVAAPSVNPYRKSVKPYRDESRRFIREAEVLKRAADAIRNGEHWKEGR